MTGATSLLSVKGAAASAAPRLAVWVDVRINWEASTFQV